MSHYKHASTEAADAFAEAVSKVDTGKSEKNPDIPERMQRTPVSWSESKNLNYSDEVAQMGGDATSRGPDMKMAELLYKEAASRNGPYSDMIKQAFMPGAGSLARKGFGAMIKGTGKLLGTSAKAAGGTARVGNKARRGVSKGVNAVGKRLGFDMNPGAGRWAGAAAPEAGFGAHNYNKHYGY